MMEPQSLAQLRNSAYTTVPTSPGVYWWFFPESCVRQLRIHELCDVSKLQLRLSSDGKICLYHGLAKDLAQRVAWHSAQRLTPSTLKSGFLSTFRLTLLSLNDFAYAGGDEHINSYFDALSVSWQPTSTREEAEVIERGELLGPYHYPLNIQGNKRAELSELVRHLRVTRSAYKLRHSK